jgi:hypothetical protein
MVLPYTVVLVIIFGILIYKDHHLLIVLLSLAISAIFYIHQIAITKKYTVGKMIGGDLPYQLAFALWLFAFKPPFFMHYIPFLLGNVGRLYIMTVYRSGEITTIPQELIIFQNKSEIFILFISLIDLFGFTQMRLVQLVALALIIKLKYRFYAPSRKAFNDLHFYFDRLSRSINLRSIYHVVYEFISLFSNDVQTPINPMDIYY